MTRRVLALSEVQATLEFPSGECREVRMPYPPPPEIRIPTPGNRGLDMIVLRCGLRTFPNGRQEIRYR